MEYHVSRAAAEVSLSSTGGSAESTIRWQPTVGTYDWQMTDKAGSALHGVRTGNVIHVTGTLKNKKVERDVKVDPTGGSCIRAGNTSTAARCTTTTSGS